MTGPLLSVRDLTIRFGASEAVRNIAFDIAPGETLALVGESGSGKSSLVNAMLALLPPNAGATGELLFEGEDLLAMSPRQARALRGKALATVSQDPFTALNPIFSIGRQLVALQHHRNDLSKTRKRQRALEMLERVGLSDPVARMNQYPHELSGGIRQRVSIAAALLVEPRLMIADEPTTALDATTEVQIVEIFRKTREMVDGSIVFVTHDMGLVGELCDTVAVMYAGELVEFGPVEAVFSSPRHPYTRALLACDPARIEIATRTLPSIPGTVPAPGTAPGGCIFAPRCAEAMPECTRISPPVSHPGPSRMARCLRSAA